MSDRPAWFTGSAEKTEILRRAARASGVTLDQHTPPGQDDAQELTDALADILVAEGVDENWRPTAYRDLVEGLIDGLSLYAYPD